MDYGDIALHAYRDYAAWLWGEILHPHWGNYFYWLIAISLFSFTLELLKPWRADQARLRRDFWLDGFYMFFNFYIFKLVIFMAFSNVTEMAFSDLFGGDLKKLALVDISVFPAWAQLLIFFVELVCFVA